MSKRNRKGFLSHDSPSVPVNKRLNFDLHVDEETDILNDLSHQFDIELEQLGSDTEELDQFDKFSPCRTRSGLVYESGNKKHKFLVSSSRHRHHRDSRKLRSRTLSGQSGTGHLADCSENESETSNVDYTEELVAAPPPLNYYKPAVSRFSQIREKNLHDIPSSPISSNMLEDHKSPVKDIVAKWPREPRNLFSDGHSPFNSPSPPSHTMRAMRLFDGLGSPNSACAISSPKSAPKLFNLKSRLLFEEDGARRSSLPMPLSRTSLHECDSTSTSEKPKMANINPFTPEGMVATSRKRNRSQASSVNTSFSPRPGPSTHNSMVDSDEDEDEDRDTHSPLPTKRVRVSDINITRYQEEFLELAEIASGEFGVVKKARHRLDGMVYAIKVSKKTIRKNSHDEKMAMNEVFAHAALMKHKHVVRYYNSWVENGAIYIQNEYCEGGSLQRKIEENRRRGERFSEGELRRVLGHVAKGLQYIHSKQLVHLDIKPGNIFIALENNAPSPQRIVEHQTTDSGAASGDLSPQPSRQSPEAAAGGWSSSDSSPGEFDKVYYKIGDLGHVAPVLAGEGGLSPEEGDCRYMAPEFLQMDVDPSKLTKADVFSLGLTIYEAASLKPLPRNSLDDPNYENIKRGKLQYLHCYSEDFNNLVSSMVTPDPNLRPTAARIVSSCDLNPASLNKSRSQLYKELRETREKLLMLEEQLSADKRRSQRKQR